MAYDGIGQVLLHINVRGVEEGSTYDVAGRVVQTTVNGARTAARTYTDVAGADGLWTTREQDGNGNTTAHTSDALHREVISTDAAGYAARTYYDATVKRASVDRKGYLTSIDNDPVDRPLVQREAGLDGSVKYSQTFSYDDNARTETAVDRRGIVSVRTRDGLGRQVSSARGAAPDVQTSGAAYDANGNAVQETDADGHMVARVFDGANRLLSETRGAGTADATTVQLSLGADGNKIEISNPRTGSFVSHDDYDGLNRPVRSEDALGNVTSRAYDGAGNVLCERRPLGGAAFARGAAAGLQLSDIRVAVCSGAYVTEHSYDDRGDLSQTLDAAGGNWTFLYDGARNLVAKLDANGHLTTYEYDSRNQRAAEHQHPDLHAGVTLAALPLGEVPVNPDAHTGTLDWTWSYDRNGSPLGKTDPKGQVTNWAYGILNRLDSESYSGFVGVRERPSLDGIDRQYDENGNLLAVAEHKLTAAGAITENTNRSFDGLDRLKVETRYDGKQVSYTFDAKGNRLSVSDPDGVATVYTYDALDRLKTAAIPEGTTRYSYYADSFQKTATFPNGSIEQRSYDLASRLTGISTSKSQFVYSFDTNGNRAQQLETRTDPATQLLKPTETTRYGYDLLDRLVAVQYPAGRAVLYRLDPVGNRLGERESSAYSGRLDLTAFAAATNLTHDFAATFDNVDWLRSRLDAIDASKNTQYTYDLAGNMISKTTLSTARELRWDIRNTLTAVLDNSIEVGRYDYDRNLQRVKRKTATEQVEYVLDGSFVLAEADGSVATHSLRRRYHYSEHPLAISEVGGASRSTNFVGDDALGSVSDAIAMDGTVRAARQHDAWGNHRGASAPASTQFKLGFTGHQFDPESGLVYARARYYDSATGSFLSRDSYEGSMRDAPSLHRYAYAKRNPLRYVDTTGFESSVLQGLKALAGVLVGAVEAIVVPTYQLAYDFTGAALYGATGDNAYKPQLDAASRLVDSVAQAAHDPASIGKLLLSGVSGQLDKCNAATDSGDAFSAGRAVGNFSAQVLTAIDAVQGAKISIDPSLGAEAARAVAATGINMAVRVGPRTAIDSYVLAASAAAGTETKGGSGRPDENVVIEEESGPKSTSDPAEAPRQESQKTYQTYTKTNPRTGKVYSGRTSGSGTPQENIDTRSAGHKMNDEGYGPAVMDQSSVNREAIRGREQQLIEANGGAQSTGGTSGNKINGISDTNPKNDVYLEQAEIEFGK